MKKSTILIFVFFVFLAMNVDAGRIELNQDWGWITNWNEVKYIIDGDLHVNSKITLSLSRIFYNFSNNYTFIFSPWEPGYIDNPNYFSIQVFNGCNQLSLQYFQEPLINCEKGRELELGKDYFYTLVEQFNWPQKAYQITILQNTSIKEWKDYDILLRYGLNDFVREKGDEKIFQLHKYCTGSKSQNCQTGNSISEDVILADKNYRMEKFPPYAKKDFLLNDMEYIYVEGLRNDYEVSYYDVQELTFINPLMWLILGFLLSIIPAFTIYLINRTFYSPKLKIRFNNKPKKFIKEVEKDKGTANIGLYNPKKTNTRILSLAICADVNKIKILKPTSYDLDEEITIEGETTFSMDVEEQSKFNYNIEPIYDKEFDSCLHNPYGFILGTKHAKPFFFDYHFKKDVSEAKLKVIVDAIVDETQIPKIIDMISPKKVRIKQILKIRRKVRSK